MREHRRVPEDGAAAKADRSSMTLKRQDLDDIAARTLDHYDQRAEDFWKGTRDHDVSRNIAALLRYIEGEPPFAILDLGCGPGRDVQLEPARRQRGGLEPRALRRVSRSGKLAAFHERRGIRRAGALLPARRPAARAAALARERVACSALSYAPRCPIRPRNSSRVAAESRKVPTTDEVIMTEFCFSTPRIIMHRWRASIITPTPAASIESMIASAICSVSRSCSCRRRAYMSTKRASLLTPNTRPFGMYPMWQRPK